MNGSVVPLIDKPKIDEINAESERLRSVFYEGDKLTDLEVDIQRMYLNKKMEKLILLDAGHGGIINGQYVTAPKKNGCIS